MLRYGVRVAATFLVLLTVVGCQRAPDHGVSGTAPPRPFAGVSGALAGHRSLLHRADELLTAQCMRKRGYVYKPQPLRKAEVADLRINPYGLLSSHQAMVDGYGITSAALNGLNSPPGPTARHSRRNHRAGWTRALLGDKAHRVVIDLPGKMQVFLNSDACVHKAETELYGGSWERRYDTFQVLRNRVIGATLKSTAFAAAQKKWAGCMRKRGYSARTLQASRDEISRMLASALKHKKPLRKVARAEQRTAEADASCQAKTRLWGPVAEAQSAARRRVVGRRFSAVISDLREQLATAVARARRVVRSAGGRRLIRGRWSPRGPGGGPARMHIDGAVLTRFSRG